jgi:N-acetylmuramoyl-L-alanine amidase
MRFRLSLLFTLAAGVFLMVSATASAYFVHVVTRGESLSSIAAADGVSVQQLAAANGLSPNAQLVIGSTVQIPPQGSTATASPAPVVTATGTAAGDGDNDGDDVGSSASSVAASAGSVAETAVSSGGAAGSYVVQPGDTLSAIAARAGLRTNQLAAANGIDPTRYLVSGTVLRLSGGASSVTPVSSGATSGSYVVHSGDTLSAIAARAGVSVHQLAAANGLDPNAYLLTGTVLHLAGGAGPVYVSSQTTGSPAVSQPVGAAAQGSPTDPPYPTPEWVTAPQVGAIASAQGVPASLAAAIAWQESGFNNDLVSSADARGVMQILPGTWQWIANSLNSGGPPLAPASAADNVRGGVLLLHSLLTATGGDPALAAAGYFQGLPSVQQNGLYPETQRYVQSVLALEHRFGGG